MKIGDQARLIMNPAIQNQNAVRLNNQTGNEKDTNKIGDDLNVNKGNALESVQCTTCAERKYQDQSDDSGVSFQTPTKIDPASAQSAVRGHEMEHVGREQSKAKAEGREVVSQSVTLHTGICEECGKVYISGGTTRTVTKDENPLKDAFNGILTDELYKGNNIDMYA